MEFNHIDFRPSIVPFSLTTIGNAPTDLIICIDKSGSVSNEEFLLQLNAISNIVNYLSVYMVSNGGNLKLALSTFSTNFNLILSLTGTADTVLNEGLNLLNSESPGGSTSTDEAFEGCLQQLSPSLNNEARTDARKVILFTLDGTVSITGGNLVNTLDITNSFKQGTFNSTYNPDSINGVIKMVGITSAADPVYVPGLSGTVPPVVEVQSGVGSVLISGGGVSNQDYWFLNEFSDFIDIASSIAEQSLSYATSDLINSGSYTSQSAEQFLDNGTVVPFGTNIQHVEKHSFFIKNTTPNGAYLTLNLDENSTSNRILNSSHFGVIVEGVIGGTPSTTLFGPFNSAFRPIRIAKFKHTMIRNQNTNAAQNQNQPSWKFEIEENMQSSTADFLVPGVFIGNQSFPVGFDLSGINAPLDPCLLVSSEGKGNNGVHSVVYDPSDNTFNFSITGMMNNTYIKGTYLLI